MSFSVQTRLIDPFPGSIVVMDVHFFLSCASSNFFYLKLVFPLSFLHVDCFLFLINCRQRNGRKFQNCAAGKWRIYYQCRFFIVFGQQWSSVAQGKDMHPALLVQSFHCSFPRTHWQQENADYSLQTSVFLHTLCESQLKHNTASSADPPQPTDIQQRP